MKTIGIALWTSVARTVVPIIVGAALGWASSAGIAVDPEFEGLLTAALTAGFATAYYVAARLLETYVTPRLGVLLGSAKTPTYAKHSA